MQRYLQAKKDYEYLVEHHGSGCNDLTGGYVADEAYFELLRNPTKKNAYHHYCNLISYFAYAGYEKDSHSNKGSEPDFGDDEVCNIFRRNCDEQQVLISWGVNIYEDGEDEDGY